MSGPEDDDPSRHAADDPTAMWDESDLKAAGIEVDQHASSPATVPDMVAVVEPSIDIDASLMEEAPRAPIAAAVKPMSPSSAARALGRANESKAPAQGPSLTLTFIVAITLGCAVYLIIRLLR